MSVSVPATHARPGRDPARQWVEEARAHIDHGRHAQAIEACERALAVAPDHVEACFHRGRAEFNLGRHEAALASYDRAIELARGTPQPALHFNRGHTLICLGREQHDPSRLAAAVASFEQAVAQRPGYAQALYNRAIALDEMLQCEAAAAGFDQVIALEPGHVDAHWNRSLTRLRLGDWERGWQEFHWRTRGPGGTRPLTDLTPHVWDGKAPLEGRHILLHGEGGLGDMIHYGRYAPLVARLGARVTVWTTAPLLQLMRSLPGPLEVVAEIERLEDFELHCSLMDLPAIFDTRPDTVPFASGYLKADPQQVELWAERLGPRRKALRVGLAWSGNPEHQDDRNRSLSLARLAPLLTLLAQDAEWICLQKELREADRAALAGLPGLRFMGEAIGSFADTAALCEGLDVVIAVDTSVAHLAGALGRPVWIMLPFHADARWLLQRTDSPWYESARLFRPERPGGWDGVLDAVGAALRLIRVRERQPA